MQEHRHDTIHSFLLKKGELPARILAARFSTSRLGRLPGDEMTRVHWDRSSKWLLSNNVNEELRQQLTLLLNESSTCAFREYDEINFNVIQLLKLKESRRLIN
jgi:hypothetical protein